VLIASKALPVTATLDAAGLMGALIAATAVRSETTHARAVTTKDPIEPTARPVAATPILVAATEQVVERA
jgi:hypothetical protein